MPMNKENLYKDIDTVFNNVIHFVTGVDDEQLNKVPFADSWTIGQVAEHIIICSRGIPDHNTTDAGRPYDANTAELKSIFLNMDQKSEAAPRVSPHTPPHKKEELIPGLEANKKLLLKIIAERDLLKLCLDMEFPYMGHFTRYEWLYFVGVHTQRHLNQIQHIKQYFANT